VGSNPTLSAKRKDATGTYLPHVFFYAIVIL